MIAGVQSPVYRFGGFELDSARRVLLKNGGRVALTPKALDVLLALVERSGELVSKDELLQIVWPNSVVEEISLTRNISVLRKILGEKPGEHNYIVTVPGTGYRFVAPVERANISASAARQPRLVRIGWLTGAAVLSLLAISVIAWYFRPQPAPSAWRPVPLTSYLGFERHPAISPDGNHVAFAWDGEKQNNFDIYIKTIRSGKVLRLTTDPSEDVSPAWSPDGTTIASLRRVAEDRNEILLTPASGGMARRLAETAGEFRVGLPSLTWSPDGRWLAVSHREAIDSANGLFLVSAQTGEKRRLSAVPVGSGGDYAPVFSPDGRSLAFVRQSGWSTAAIHVLPLSSTSLAVGEPRQLTTEGRLVRSPVWTGNGRHIAYIFAAANRDTPREVQIMAVTGASSPESLPLVDSIIAELSLGRHLVYNRQVNDDNIWRVDIARPGLPLAVPVRLISSTLADARPQYSPDGKRIAFSSNRSGHWEIWTANPDGSNPVKLTSLNGSTIVNWSPDGQRIAFQSVFEGQTDVFTIAAAGGSPTRLTKHPSDDRVPSYSHDGRWIYFSSLRSGRWQVWKMPREGGEAVQVTRSEPGSYMGQESPDGRTLYYCHKLPEKGIWKVPVAGGEGVQVTGPYSPPFCGLDVTEDGLYYNAASSPNQYSIAFFDFSTGKTRPVVISDRPIGSLALSVSPDKRSILYTQTDHSGSDLMIVENFRLP